MSMSPSAPQPRWKRLRRRIANLVQRHSLLSHQYALLDGIDHAASYVSGYVAASQGRAINDHSERSMPGAAVHCVWWRAGWQDYTDNKPADPYAFAQGRYREMVKSLRAGHAPAA